MRGKFYTDTAGRWYHSRPRRFWFAKVTGPYTTFDELWHELKRS